jgi:hypothetical protein
MANRHIDPRRIKIHFPYSVEEAAAALGMHRNTIRLWIKQGLPVADDRRPLVMSGIAIRDLRAGAQDRQEAASQVGGILLLLMPFPEIPCRWDGRFHRVQRRSRHSVRLLSRLRNDHAPPCLVREARESERKTRGEDFPTAINKMPTPIANSDSKAEP